MGFKNFTYFPAESKAVTFSTDAIDITRDIMVAIGLTTSSQSSLNVSVQLEVSLDGSTWLASGSPTVITSNTTSYFTLVDTPYSYTRLTSTRTAGTATFFAKAQTKGWG